jgi:hypothetical protein
MFGQDVFREVAAGEAGDARDQDSHHLPPISRAGPEARFSGLSILFRIHKIAQYGLCLNNEY